MMPVYHGRRRATCINGCGVPPAPPSWVICSACMDRITQRLEYEIARLEGRTDVQEPAALPHRGAR